MKRDPFPLPIDLGKGPFKFVADNSYVLTDMNFWRLAKRVHAYRTENKLKPKPIEDIQLEIIKAIRVKRGLAVEQAANQPFENDSAVQRFVKKRYRSGCSGCGRRHK